MLQLIRDRAQGIVIWTIVGLIIITFALFGLNSYLSDAPNVNAATVNGAEITQNDFARAFQGYQQRMQQSLGENYRADLFNEEIVKKEVIDALINDELIKQELEQAGFKVAPQQVMEKITQIKAFHDTEGKFSTERYKQILNSQRINGFRFEQDIAEELAGQQLKAGIILSSFVTDKELDNFIRLIKQERKIDYAVLQLSSYLEMVKVSQDEIDQYYTENKHDFMTEEKVSVAYVELDINEISKRFEVSDEEISQYYEQQKQNYVKQPEQRKASHILIKVDAETDETTAKNKIEEIKAKINNGESFEKLAGEFSQDIGSAKQGGDLGFFARGVMDKAFEDVAFKLDKGQVSEPVRSKFGYHLIKVEEIKEQQVSSLDELRDSIKHDLQLQQAEQTYYSNVDTLNNLSYEVPDSLQPAVDELGLELKTSRLFTRKGGEGVLANRKVVDAAFSEEVLSQGRNSQLLELSDSHVMVLRVAKHVPSSQLDKKDVVSDIENILRNKRAMSLLEEDRESILKQLKSGTKPDALRAKQKITWKNPGFITRNRAQEEQSVDPAIVDVAFRMNKPVSNEVLYASAKLANGDEAILSLSEIREGAKTDNVNPQKQTLMKLYVTAMERYWLQNLRNNAEISINMEIAK